MALHDFEQNLAQPRARSAVRAWNLMRHLRRSQLTHVIEAIIESTATIRRMASSSNKARHKVDLRDRALCISYPVAEQYQEDDPLSDRLGN